jgi:predicted kinase
MKKLIIISGPPAAGKTTLAWELAKKLDIPCFGKDDFKEALNDKDNILAYKAMYKMAKQHVKNDILCIIESNFIPELDRPQIVNKIVPELWIFEIYCTADPITLKERFKARERHPVHSDMSLDISEHKPILPNRCLRVDTAKRTIDETTKHVLTFWNNLNLNSSF